MFNFIFLGTPHLSKVTMKEVRKHCIVNNHKLVGVVSQDKEKTKSAVLDYSKYLNIVNISIIQINSLNIDMGIVAGFGKIISRDTLQKTKLGFINIHTSLLPRWRGSSPVYQSIYSNDIEYGISVMKLLFKLDSGEVYINYRIKKNKNEQILNVNKRLNILLKKRIKYGILGIVYNKIKYYKQNSLNITKADFLKKKNGKIEWENSECNIINKSLASEIWPGSYASGKYGHINMYNGLGSIYNRFIEYKKRSFIQSKYFLFISNIDSILIYKYCKILNKKKISAKDINNGYIFKIKSI